MRIEPFDRKGASDHQYAALNAFRNRMRAERLPGDPPIPLDEHVRRWQSTPAFVAVHVWNVWREDSSEIIAAGEAEFLHTAENRHLMEFGIDVLPEVRRQGIGRRLLSLIAEVAHREQRTLLITATSGNIPAGEAFMKRLGARMGLTLPTHQLVLQDLNRDLLRQWQARARERASEFALDLWTDEIPEEHIQAFATLFEVMNLAPRGDLEVEDFHWTPEHLRESQRSDRARGAQSWIMVVCERETGALAGFTQVVWHPNRPENLDQRSTAVLPQYQNRGLGRWLKAAMLERVLRERPQVKRVRTGNADANAPMLRINQQLGFKLFESRYVWQVETEKVQAYLSRHVQT
ncbi:MAG: GNAT family N-acetyltransferase [Armatimonadota bacterium]